MEPYMCLEDQAHDNDTKVEDLEAEIMKSKAILASLAKDDEELF